MKRFLLFLTVTSLIHNDGFSAQRTHHRIRVGRASAIRKPKATSLVFSADGSQLALATLEGTYFVRTRSGNLIAHCKFPTKTAAFNEDGTRIVLANSRKQILFDLEQSRQISVSEEFVRGFVGMSIRRENGKLMITRIDEAGPVGKGGQVQVGDELVAVGDGRIGSMISVVGDSPRNAITRIGGPAGTYVRLEVIPRNSLEPVTYMVRRCLRKIVARKYSYSLPQRSALEHNLAWILGDHGYEFASATTGQTLARIDARNIRPDDGVRAISADGRQFAIVGEFIRPLKSQQPVPTTAETSRRARGGRITNILGSVRDDIEAGEVFAYFGVEVYDIATQELKATFPVENEPVNTVVRVPSFFGASFTSDGKQLVIGTWSKLHVYDVSSGHKVREMRIESDSSSRLVQCFAISDRLAAVGDVNGAVRILDLKTGKTIETIDHWDDNYIEAVSFSPDGKFLAYYTHGELHVVDLSNLDGTTAGTSTDRIATGRQIDK